MVCYVSNTSVAQLELSPKVSQAENRAQKLRLASHYFSKLIRNLSRTTRSKNVEKNLLEQSSGVFEVPNQHQVWVGTTHFWTFFLQRYLHQMQRLGWSRYVFKLTMEWTTSVRKDIGKLSRTFASFINLSFPHRNYYNKILKVGILYQRRKTRKTRESY